MNDPKIFQRAINYTKILLSKALQIGIFVLKYTIWQPWRRFIFCLKGLLLKKQPQSNKIRK
jgi:hypothetical protein